MAENDTELFSKDKVITAMNTMGDIFTTIAETYASTDSEMATQLTTADGAMYGAGATKLLSAWDENSGTLEDFMSTFDNWSALVSGMAAKFTNLEEGTYEVKGLDDEYKKAVSAARAFHTTSLKTTAGAEAFNTAQQNYFAEHPELTSLDENGIGYTSIKTLDHGKIVEARVYTAEDGTQYAEVERWGWSEEEGKFVTTTDYYKDVTIDEDTGKLNFDENKKLTKEEFYSEDYYYSDKNKELILKNTSDRLTAEYLENGELSEETLKELDNLPDGMKEKVLEELQNRKDSLGELDGVRKYDENGKLESITYTGDDGLEYTIQYEYDEDGNVTGVKYLVNGKPISNKDESVHDFYSHILGNENQSGEGTTGSEPTYTVEDGTVTYSVTDEEGKTTTEYSLSNENDQTILKIGENEYIVEYDENGFVFKYADIGKEVDEETAQELTEAMKALMGNNYAKGLINYQDGDVQYSIDEEGNVSTHQELDGADGKLPKGNLDITYNPDGTIKEITFTDENGVTNNYTEEQLEGLLNPEPIDNGDGTVSSYEYDPSNGNITITTTDKDDETKVKRVETIDKTTNQTTIETYNYDETTGLKTSKDIEIKDADGNVIETGTTEYVYDEQNNEVGYTETTNGGEPEYYYIDSETDEMVQVSEEQYGQLTSSEPAYDDDQNPIEYEVSNGKYITTTVDKEDETKVLEKITLDIETGITETEEHDYDKDTVTTTTKIPESEDSEAHEYIKVESGNGDFISGEYDEVPVDEDELEKLIDGVSSPDEEGNYTEYSVVKDEDGEHNYVQEVKKNSDGEQLSLRQYEKVINPDTEELETKHTYEYEYDETDHDVIKSRTVDNCVVTEEQEKAIREGLHDNTEATIEEGQFVTYTYNDNGKPASCTTETTNGDPVLTKDFTYRSDGTLLQTLETVHDTNATVQTNYDTKEIRTSTITTETNGTATTTTTINYQTDGETPKDKTINGNNLTLNYDYASDLTNNAGEAIGQNHAQKVRYNGEITITYQDDGVTIKEETLTSGSIEIHNTYSDDGKIETYQKIAGTTVHEVSFSETGRMTTEVNTTYANSNRDENQITRIVTSNYSAGKYTGGRTDHPQTNEYEVFDSERKIISRQVKVDDVYFSYDENGVVTTNHPTYNKSEDSYNFTPATIDAMAKTRQMPQYAGKDQESVYTDFLENAEEGNIIIFEKGSYFQYDPITGDSGYEIPVYLDEGAAYQVQGDKLVNLNDPTEYYYIDILKDSGSYMYGANKGDFTYDQLRIMRENYNGEGNDGYSETNIDKWTVGEAYANSAKPLDATNLGVFDTDNPIYLDSAGGIYKIDGAKTGEYQDKAKLKEEGYMASLLEDPTSYKIVLGEPKAGTEYRYNEEYHCYAYVDSSTNTMYLYDAANNCIYKSK